MPFIHCTINNSKKEKEGKEGGRKGGRKERRQEGRTQLFPIKDSKELSEVRTHLSFVTLHRILFAFLCPLFGPSLTSACTLNI
jgi:hypothetical protein